MMTGATTASVRGQVFGGNIICASRIRPARQSPVRAVISAACVLPVLGIPACALSVRLGVPLNLCISSALLLSAVFGASVRLHSDWSFSSGRLSVRSGLMTKIDRGIYAGGDVRVELTRTPLLTLFGACAMRVGMSFPTGSAPVLTLGRDDVRRTVSRLIPSEGQPRTLLTRDRRCAALSALQGRENAVLLALPAAFELSRRVPSGHPWSLPAVLLAASLPLTVRALLLFAAMSRSHGLKVSLGEKLLTVRSGSFRRRLLRLPVSAVPAVDVRRPALLRENAARRVTLAGCGGRSAMPCTERQLRMFLSSLMPHTGAEITISAPADYTDWRTAAGLAVCFAAAVLWLRSGELRLWPLTVPELLMCLCLTAAASRREGRPAVSLCADSIELSALRGLSLHRQRIRRDAVAMTVVMQSPFQRLNGSCTLTVCPADIRSRCFMPLKCRGLPFERTAALAERL